VLQSRISPPAIKTLHVMHSDAIYCRVKFTMADEHPLQSQFPGESCISYAQSGTRVAPSSDGAETRLADKQNSTTPRRAVTSYDVAQHAGVSQSAVSRCFKTGASISKATRAKVMKSAIELGYQPNAMAQGLITRRSNLVAVMISNLTNLYYPEVLAELTQRLAGHGVKVLLFSLSHESDVDEVLQQVWSYRVDGAIVAARLSPEQILDFQRRDVPLVLYNRVEEGAACDSVCCDSAGGERQLVQGLLEAGHRHFGIIAGPSDSYVGEERVRSAVECLARSGQTNVPVVRGEFDYDTGRAGFKELLQRTSGKIDAVVCANDLMAIGAVDGARHDHGREVPGDVSVVGFDGVGPATWQSYRLTTIRQPVRRMTDAAVTMLMARIADPSVPPERRLFSGQLLPGSSARLQH
jgi:DNA-binding LacI/PurR family transcriptional regulator